MAVLVPASHWTFSWTQFDTAWTRFHPGSVWPKSFQASSKSTSDWQ